MQAKTLFISTNMFEKYYSDSLKISKQSLINIILSNGTYTLKKNIENVKTKVLLLVGEKEFSLMKKSVKLLNDKLLNSIIHISKKMGHGELSMRYPKEYVKIIKDFFVK